MGYMHIENLYKNRVILLFKECYALEKIHGTSAHISWNGEKVLYFSGGEKQENFIKLFNDNELTESFKALGKENVVIFGEAYGGKCQGMSETYGKELRFIAFEVKIGDVWLCVPDAEQVALSLGLEFVSYSKINTDQYSLDTELNMPSAQALRNGIEGNHKREGIVLRPLIELRKNNGERIIAKYKHDDFRETAHTRPMDQDKLKVLSEAKEIADEWVTEMRLTHVLDLFKKPYDIEITGNVIKAMIEDVTREAQGEIVDSKDVRAAIGKRTAQMFKARIKREM
jgi:hypothetical protein